MPRATGTSPTNPTYAVNRDEARFPTSSRYQYPSAVFLLLILGEGLRGLRIPRIALIATAAVGVVAAWGGISLMDREFSGRWRPVSDSTRSSLAAVELVAPRIDPRFPVSLQPVFTVAARRYLTVVRRYDSPAFEEARLAAQTEPLRAAADLTMAQALDLRLQSPGLGRQSCDAASVLVDGDSGAALKSGAATIRNSGRSRVDILLRRFADQPSVSLGGLEPGETALLRVPDDRARAAWQVGIRGGGAASLCAVG